MIRRKWKGQRFVSILIAAATIFTNIPCLEVLAGSVSANDDAEEIEESVSFNNAGNDLSVSGNNAAAGTLTVSGNDEILKTQENFNIMTDTGTKKWEGNTIPVDSNNMVPRSSGDISEKFPDSYILSTDSIGNITDGDEQESDWAYALCSALESGLKKKYPDENIDINCKDLITYLYAASKEEQNDKYGKISRDLVKDPDGGSQIKRGNVHTAMWAVATGYAIKSNGQKYRLNNIYLYQGQEKNKIKSALINRGEVVTSLYREQSYFQINEESTSEYKKSYCCSQKPDESEIIEHTVSIVGWDDNYSYLLFKNGETYLNNRNGAWLVKDVYEEENYYWVSYYDIALDTTTQAGGFKYGNVFCYSFDIEKADDYANTYQYDGGSSYYAYGASISVASADLDTISLKAMNIFPKANQAEVLEAVSFGTYTLNADYLVQVYLHADTSGPEPILSDPLFKEPVRITDCSQWGYYTINLLKYQNAFQREPILKGNGGKDSFAVEVTIKPDEKDADGNRKFSNMDALAFWVDGQNNLTSGKKDVIPICSADQEAKGQSFLYQDGKWIDFSQDMSVWKNFPRGIGSNIRIKAHTRENIAIAASNGTEVWAGEELKLDVILANENADGLDGLKWSVDNEKIARVQDGAVRGLAAGYVNVTVETQNYGSDTIRIMVKDVAYQQKVSLCSNSSYPEKRRAQVTPVFYPEEYRPDRVEYVIPIERDGDYIFVDDKGVITAKTMPEPKDDIVVLLRIWDGSTNIEKRIQVNCYQIPKEFSIVNAEQQVCSSYDMKVLEQLQLGIQIIKPIGAVSDIIWQSSNPSVAFVSQEGEVFARQEGSAVITAMSEDDPSVRQNVTIHVKNRISRIELSENYISLKPGEVKNIKLQVYPKEMEAEQIRWSICDLKGNDLGLDNKVVTFDEKNMTITALNTVSSSISEVRLYAECEGIKSSCYIKVEKPVTSLQLSFSQTDILAGRTITMPIDNKEAIFVYPHINGEEAENCKEILFYSSSNNRVAAITTKGEIMPVQTGSTIITAKTKEGLSSSVRLTIVSEYDNKQLLLSTGEERIYVNDTGIISVSADGVALNPNHFDWKSSDESVAKVDSNGIMWARSKGSVKITATDRYNPDNQAVLSIQTAVRVRDISLSRTYVEIAKGNTISLDCSVLPVNADNRQLTLSAEDDTIVSCSGNKITALEAGITTITIKSTDGAAKLLKVKVNKEQTAGIKAGIDKRYITTKGTAESKANITATAYSADGNSRTVSQIFDFSSEDPRIAQVDKTGVITGGEEGETVICISATDGSDCFAYVNVEVRKHDSGIKSVALNHSKVELKNGDSLNLIATILPESAPALREVAWKSFNDAIAVVDQNGKVTAKGFGKTYIVAETLDGKKRSQCEIRVLPIASQIKLSKISGQVLESASVNPDSRYQAAVYGSDGINYANYCEFTSSNRNICIVDEKGVVTPVPGAEKGSCTITAKVKDDIQGRKVSFKVKIVNEKQAANIRVIAETSLGEQEVNAYSPLYLSIDESQDITLKAYAIDNNGNYIPHEKLKWSVSDKKVVSVKAHGDDSANMAVLKKGNTVLTCTVQDNKKCTVSIPVYILDAKPVFEMDALTINLQKQETILVPVHIEDDVELVDMDVAYIAKGRTYQSEGIRVSKAGALNDQCMFSYDSKHLTKGNYVISVKVKMKFRNTQYETSFGSMLKKLYHDQDEVLEIIEIPVKVIDQQPKVKIRIPNINVFYKDAETKVELTANEEITNVVLTDYKDNAVTDAFSVITDNQGVQLQAATNKQGTYDGVFQVYLKDYVHPVSVKCKIKTVITKPKLQVRSNSLYVYRPEDKKASVVVGIFNTEEDCLINSADGYEIMKDGSVNGQEVVISNLDFYGKKNIILSVTNPKLWNDSVDVKVPVTIENENKITVDANCKKISINKKIVNDSPVVNVYMKQGNLSINKVLDVEILDSKKKLYSNIQWQETAEGNGYAIAFMAQDNCQTGKYQATVRVQASNQKTYEKVIPLIVEEKTPSVKITLKGKIDLYDRANTYMTGTLTIQYASGQVMDVKAERNDFNVKYDIQSKQFLLSLKSTAEISRKKQTVIFDVYLSNGTVLRKAVNINLTESKVKWKNQDALVLYKDLIGETKYYDLLVESPVTLSPVRSDITIVSVPRGISVVGVRGSLRIRMTDESVKPGRYKIGIAVKFDSSAKNTAAIKRDIWIQVK